MNSHIVKFIFISLFLMPAVTLATESSCASLKLPAASFELRLGCHATWVYSFTSRGSEYTQKGQYPWNYQATLVEKIVGVRQLEGVTVFEALRTLKNHRGRAPQSDLMPHLGTIYYILKEGEVAYAHWDAYQSQGDPTYKGMGIYVEYGHLDLAQLASAPILYVLPLRAPSAWHQTISERTEANPDHFLGGPRCEASVKQLKTAAGWLNNCYKITLHSTTTQDESWVCRGLGLVEQIQEREGGEGHGSLVYRSETQLVRKY